MKSLNCLWFNSIFFWYTEGAVFDASQYAFFGKDVTEEVELGGLDDERVHVPAVDSNQDDFFLNRQEVIFWSYPIFSSFQI